MSKAYDTVWREGLWYKMSRYGVQDKFIRICKGLYDGVKASVLIVRGLPV